MINTPGIEINVENDGGRTPLHIAANVRKVIECIKMSVTVKSSGCLQIGFGPLIIYYICDFLFDPPNSS